MLLLVGTVLDRALDERAQSVFRAFHVKKIRNGHETW